jgi:hypothetical protein
MQLDDYGLKIPLGEQNSLLQVSTEIERCNLMIKVIRSLNVASLFTKSIAFKKPKKFFTGLNHGCEATRCGHNRGAVK